MTLTYDIMQYDVDLHDRIERVYYTTLEYLNTYTWSDHVELDYRFGYKNTWGKWSACNASKSLHVLILVDFACWHEYNKIHEVNLLKVTLRIYWLYIINQK